MLRETGLKKDTNLESHTCKNKNTKRKIAAVL